MLQAGFRKANFRCVGLQAKGSLCAPEVAGAASFVEAPEMQSPVH